MKNPKRIAGPYATVAAVSILSGPVLGNPEPANAARDETVRVRGTDIGFELRLLPAGTLDLGSEQVEIAPLWVGTTEVTWELYDIYLYKLDEPKDGVDDSAENDAVTRPSKPYVPPDRGYGHAGYPAMGMTRLAAVRFCEWLSDKTGDTYRLPTQAEWIYLAETGTNEKRRGDDRTSWTDDNADYTTHPVAKKSANQWGLHDTLGNVSEWIAPGRGQRPQDNPIAMGGNFLESANDCTTRTAMPQTPTWNASDPQIPKSQWWLADCDFVGFRIVREPKRGAQAIDRDAYRQKQETEE